VVNGSPRVSSFGLGLGIGGPPYQASQPPSRFSGEMEEREKKRGGKTSDREIFEGV
jgi:hypothetical protein